ncbi:MAG: prephenate dehydrogenase/arogenate dehydrogenase family protein [Thermodesulfovibrionales bacterium]|nr:prephenate dehydrogenase/arogenate dehydrogenase family protein [Thermodesulfovibrionales bacterium]MDP3111486.1 prephenate dehydrogenase/arogenate dehydrogenase family protein [Thermodesulfovibrionales bacterium]
MDKLFFNKVTILGVGLIGASLALALRKKKLCREIVGYGRKENNLKKAKRLKIIDSYNLDAKKACSDSDLIVFSIPVGKFLVTAGKIKGSLKKGALVTDVGSVKGRLVRDMESLMPGGVNFVGSHPIAGSNKNGIGAANAELFSGAQCIVTPTKKTDMKALKKITALWKSLGARTVNLDADEHDRVYAAVSHLPHIIAYALVNAVSDIDSSYIKFAGQGFKDSTRIASSSPEIWRDICLMNKNNILKFINVFNKNLDSLGRHIQKSNSPALEKEFKKARTLREDVR